MHKLRFNLVCIHEERINHQLSGRSKDKPPRKVQQKPGMFLAGSKTFALRYNNTQFPLESLRKQGNLNISGRAIQPGGLVNYI